MSPRPAPFRQIDVTRALKAAKAAGLEVAKIEISPEGSIVISNKVDYAPTTVSTVAPEPSALERWKEKQDAKRAKTK
jgi:hypothetical protein